MADDARTASELRDVLTAGGYDASGLTSIGVRPGLGEYLRQLWGRRHFIWYDSRQRTATSNSDHILGNLWLFLRPLLDALFYFIIFGLVLNLSRGTDNFPAFLIIGILFYRSTATALGSGSGIIRSNKSMIRAFMFPRASIPVSTVLQNSMTAVYTLMVMLVTIMVIPPHVWPHWTWILIVPIFALQCLMNLGITFITSRLGFHFPDITNVLSLLARFLMYGSGVMFPIERFVGHPTALLIIQLNPLFQVIDMARTVLMDGALPSAASWLILAGWTAVLLVGGLIFFWRAEETYGRELR